MTKRSENDFFLLFNSTWAGIFCTTKYGRLFSGHVFSVSWAFRFRHKIISLRNMQCKPGGYMRGVHEHVFPCSHFQVQATIPPALPCDFPDMLAWRRINIKIMDFCLHTFTVVFMFYFLGWYAHDFLGRQFFFKKMLVRVFSLGLTWVQWFQN